MNDSQTQQNTTFNMIISALEILKIEEETTATASTSTFTLQAFQIARERTEDSYDNDKFFELLRNPGPDPIRPDRNPSPYRNLNPLHP